MQKKTVVIKEPYWGAWKEFGWDKGVWGIGLSERILFGTPGAFLRIHSQYHKVNYIVNLADAVKESRECRNKPSGVKLFVIPMTILKLEEGYGNSKVVAKSGQPEEQKEKVSKPGKKVSQETQPTDLFL